MEQPAAWPRRLFAGLRVRMSNYLFWVAVALEVLCGWRPWDVDDFSLKEVLFGDFLIVSGLVLRTWAAGVIRKSAAFACTGPYVLSCHPLYFGSLLMMLGFCTLIGHPANFLIVLGPVWMTYAAAIQREEALLASRFPQDWDRHRSQSLVQRVWSHPGDLLADWSPTTWWKNREYRAVVGTLIGFAGLRVWFELPDAVSHWL